MYGLFWGSEKLLEQLDVCSIYSNRRINKDPILENINNIYSIVTEKVKVKVYSGYINNLSLISDEKNKELDIYHMMSTIDTCKLYESIKSKTVKLTFLPDNLMLSKYLFKLEKKDKYVYIACPMYFHFISKYWVINIFEGDLHTIEYCTNISNYRDGGSTLISTSNDNSIWIPYKLSNEKSTLNTFPLVSLSINKNTIQLENLNLPTKLLNLLKIDLYSNPIYCPMINYYV